MLAYLFLSKVTTITQSNSLSTIFPFVHFCLTNSQKHWQSKISWLAVFARLRRLYDITSWLAKRSPMRGWVEIRMPLMLVCGNTTYEHERMEIRMPLMLVCGNTTYEHERNTNFHPPWYYNIIPHTSMSGIRISIHPLIGARFASQLVMSYKRRRRANIPDNKMKLKILKWNCACGSSFGLLGSYSP